MDKCVVILAAGAGTRMKSALPKVLHRAAGLPMVEWVVRAAEDAGARPVVVYGHGGTAVPDALGDRCDYVLQAERRGSGHAVMAARDAIAASGAKYVCVLAGDMPLVRGQSIRQLMEYAEAGEYAALLLTGHLDDPTGYGRIVREEGAVTRIVEEKDATPEEKRIQEVNLSFYCFQTGPLLTALSQLTPNNAQGEYYLTDCVALLHQAGLPTGAIPIGDMGECDGVNDRVQLARAAAELRQRINEGWMRAGVTLIDPQATYIDADVQIGADTVIYPGVTLEGRTAVGSGCTLYPGSRIVDSEIGDGTVVQNSVLLDTRVGARTQIGPYAYLRPGTVIGDGCRVGDFVETKNATIADGAKVSHLSYVGDADVGEDVNVGCGVVFVNYDGKEKTRTQVGDRAFIGCNTNLISPVQVGEGAYIAAGATVTKDIPADALCIARAREVIKAGWGKGRYVVKREKKEE